MTCQLCLLAQTSITSANAYMLVYKQVEAPAAPAAAAAAPAAGSTSAAAESLSEPLRSKALEMLQAFKQECEQYQVIRDEALQKLQQRQQHVRNVLEAATCPSDESDSGRWLSYTWLENWASSSEPPGPIDNSVLLCPHSKLDPSKVTAMKRISTQAWSELQVGQLGLGGWGGREGLGSLPPPPCSAGALHVWLQSA
jgi:ubiquitin carboxyl-terminal hydrolase 48